MIHTLSKPFTTPADVHEHYCSSSVGDVQLMHPSTSATLQTDVVSVCVQSLAPLGADVQLRVLAVLFCNFVSQNSHTSLPHDFLKLSMLAMERLKKASHKNVIYLLAKALGTTHHNGSYSLLPLSRMPLGLLST